MGTCCTGQMMLSKMGKPLLLCRVTQIEAERLEESREAREAFKRMLREEVNRQASEKHIQVHLPDDES